ncbi:TonB-dependent receptor [Mesonia aestuariivivens]|uniref:TonB-dependent receptor n=1 Tax=Mesonia aestuariivivens TaxID=2796128 RepID=A0ABS6W030_9FLAO|nr:TonB-dependent receptor [Mesonia aestuariivivens]MBW2960479.1 TonB-dependent receptor [Mesonia aestuariivivens]
MKTIINTLICLVSAFSFAQGTGSIAGLLNDKETGNQPLPFANVTIKGTGKGTTTDFDGLYQIENIEPGSYTVVFSFVGYETLEVPNVKVVANKVTTINSGLGASAAALDEVLIQVVNSREKESALLLEQKKAVEMKQSIGTQELARKGVSDASTAVTKTTGISKEEGSSNIYVRGLGDRYNSTMFNGLPIPSNNSLNKNIDLGIFSTDIIEAIDIDKTYVTRNYGDFGGASINIAGKDYKGPGFFEVNIGTGVNTNAIGVDKFKQQDGPNFTGFYDKNPPANALSGYNFDTSWELKDRDPINTSLGFTGGKSFDLGTESRISLFGHASFGNDFTYKEGIARGGISTQGVARKNFDYESYDYTTGSTFMLNSTYKINNDHNIKYNGFYINSTNQAHEEYYGTIDVFDEAANGGGIVRRSTFKRTQLLVNQLLGEHKIKENLSIDWGATYNSMISSIPDRMQNTLRPIDDDGDLSIKTLSELSDANNHRFYQELTEDEIAGRLSATFQFAKKENDYKGKITAGYNIRTKDVAFEATQYNFSLKTYNNPNDYPIVDFNNLDEFFTQSSYDQSLFQIKTLFGGSTEKPETYDGDLFINAGYINLQYNFGKLILNTGVRVENIEQNIEWITAIAPVGGESTLKETQVLPSLSLKYELNKKQNLKFAASKTYTLPQFIERAPFQYVDITNTYFGNPDLYSSTNYNADLKWEFFPKSGELISFGIFGKIIENPINETTIASATNDISWVNSGDQAKGVGAELEVRKDIFSLKSENDNLEEKLSFGTNISYLNTKQDFDAEKVRKETNYSVQFTEENGPLTGASDWLVNGDISYSKEFSQSMDIMATAAVNYFSDRLYAIGNNQRGGLEDKGFVTLDLIIKSNLTKNFGIGISAKNLLNPTVEQLQQTQNVLTRSFNKGRTLSFSASYKF